MRKLDEFSSGDELPDLARWQSALANAVKNNKDVAISQYVNNEKNIAVYQANARYALVEVLKTNYKNCCLLLGEEYFEYLAKQFVASNFPQSNNLDYYDERFVDFLQERVSAEDVLADKRYLVDVAKLDILIVKSFHAGARSEFPFAKFSNLSETQQAELRFVLANDVFFVQSLWSLDQIVLLNKGEIAALDLVEQERPLCFLVEHEDGEFKVTLLEQEGFYFLRDVKNEVGLAALLDRYPNQADRIPEYIQRKLFVDCESG